MPEIELKPAQIPFDVIVEVFNGEQQTTNGNDDKDNKMLIKNIQNNTHISVYSPRVKNSKNIFKNKYKKMIRNHKLNI